MSVRSGDDDAGRWHDRLPPRPAPELDRVLDAVERCVVRFGVSRTSMTDVAKEMGVARTTLYRQVASLEEALALVSSRRFHRFLDELLVVVGSGITPDVFVQVIVRTVRAALADPVAQRILSGEPELVGQYVTDGSLAILAGQIAELITPVVEAAAASGAIAATDASMAASWIVRIVFALCALPAPDDELEDAVRFVLRPMLDPR